ncbi:aminomethyltransferase family protein [Microbacterium kribbense]|uniref:Aminomethyltransferase family protein n=1 Tax=Microbacterium kribbense TaxID=433645 RepID=A0ABP7GIN6_9MICO
MTSTLAQALEQAGGAVNLLRNSRSVPQVVPEVSPEISNWRAEQRAWDQTCALFDQSHHMVSISMTGSGVVPLLEIVGANDFSTFGPGKAKQLVACNVNGQLIGQGILFPLGHEILLVGPHPIMDWVEYNIQTHPDLDIRYSREGTSLTRPGNPTRFRFQLQGPNALAVMRAALGTEPPKLGFFNIGEAEIADRRIGLLRHGMAAEPGYEFWGDWEDRDAVFDAVVAAGEEHGMEQVGGSAYLTTGSHSAYIPLIVPAIYSDPEYADYRNWLSDTSFEATAPLGGSFFSTDIADYYVDPFALDYGRSVSLTRDFVGRDALQAMIDSGASTRRKKVTLIWDPEDVIAVYRSFFDIGTTPGLFMQAPMARVASLQYDSVLVDGRLVGHSTRPDFSAIHRRILSPAIVDAEAGEPGSTVTVVWGEDPMSDKLRVDEHRQFEIRAVVAPAPMGDFARAAYKANA